MAILVPERSAAPCSLYAESSSETMFKFTNLVMYAAPLGVWSGVLYGWPLGLGVLLPLLKLLATMYVASPSHRLRVAADRAVGAHPHQAIYHAVAEPVTMDFATASSEASCLAPSSNWSPSASRAKSSLSFSHRVTASIWTGRSLLQSLGYFCGPGPRTAPQHRSAGFDDSDAYDSSKGTQAWHAHRC